MNAPNLSKLTLSTSPVSCGTSEESDNAQFTTIVSNELDDKFTRLLCSDLRKQEFLAFLKRAMLECDITVAGGSVLAVAREYFAPEFLQKAQSTYPYPSLQSYIDAMNHDLDLYVPHDKFFDVCDRFRSWKVAENAFIESHGVVTPPYDESFLRRNHIAMIKRFRLYNTSFDIMCVDTVRTTVQHVWNNFDLNVCQVAWRVEDVGGVLTTVMKLLNTTKQSVINATAVLNEEYHEAYWNQNVFIHKRVLKYRNRGYKVVVPSCEHQKCSNTLPSISMYGVLSGPQPIYKTIGRVPVDFGRINITSAADARLVAKALVRTELSKCILRGHFSSDTRMTSLWSDLLRVILNIPLYDWSDVHLTMVESVIDTLAELVVLHTSVGITPNKRKLQADSNVLGVQEYAHAFRPYTTFHIPFQRDSFSWIDDEIYNIAPQMLAIDLRETMRQHGSQLNLTTYPLDASTAKLTRTCFLCEIDAAVRRARKREQLVATQDGVSDYLNALLMITNTIPFDTTNHDVINALVLFGRAIEYAVILTDASARNFNCIQGKGCELVNAFFESLCKGSATSSDPHRGVVPSFTDLFKETIIKVNIVGIELVSKAKSLQDEILRDGPREVRLNVEIKPSLNKMREFVLALANRLIQGMSVGIEYNNLFTGQPDKLFASHRATMLYFRQVIQKWLIPLFCLGIVPQRFSFPPVVTFVRQQNT